MKFQKYLTESKKEYAVLGTNQDQDVCDVCGKANLKRVVWFSELNSQGEKVGDPFCTGVDCEAKLMLSGSSKKPPKRMMDNIWKVAQGIDKAKHFVMKYKTKKEFEKLASWIHTNYPLQAIPVMDWDGETPKGLIVWDLTDTNSMWSLSTSGVHKRWAEKTKEVAARNWIRNK